MGKEFQGEAKAEAMSLKQEKARVPKHHLGSQCGYIRMHEGRRPKTMNAKEHEIIISKRYLHLCAY